MMIKDCQQHIRAGTKIRTDSTGSRAGNKFFTGTVRCTHGSFFCVDRDDVSCGGGCGGAWKISFLSEGTIFINYEPKTIMTNILEMFRSLTATPQEKLLKEYGIEDPIGTPTEEGLKLSQEITYKKNREEIISIIEKIAAEDKAKN